MVDGGWTDWVERRRALSLLALLGCGLLPDCECKPRSVGLVVESVDNYSLRNGPSLSNSIANGDGFISGMTGPSSPWQLTARWTDTQVWDTDLLDHEANAIGNDHQFFDRPGTAISYFTGHGSCTDGCSVAAPCTSTSSCTTPNGAADERAPRTCRYSPFDAPRCCYMTDRMALTSGGSDQNQGQVNYTSGPVRFGESATAGGWAGAGTNGGTNLVVLDISCGILPPFWYEALKNAAAGVHLLATIMVAGGDTANISDRGSPSRACGRPTPTAAWPRPGSTRSRPCPRTAATPARGEAAGVASTGVVAT